MTRKTPPTDQAASEKAAARKGIARSAIDTSENIANLVLEKNREIWLAGLGALGTIGRTTASATPGLQSFEGLVAAGRSLEERSRALVDESTDAVQRSVRTLATRVDEQLGQFEGVFDRRVSDALARLGIPHRAEVAALLMRIEALEAQVRELEAAQQPARRGAKGS